MEKLRSAPTSAPRISKKELRHRAELRALMNEAIKKIAGFYKTSGKAENLLRANLEPLISMDGPPSKGKRLNFLTILERLTQSESDLGARRALNGVEANVELLQINIQTAIEGVLKETEPVEYLGLMTGRTPTLNDYDHMTEHDRLNYLDIDNEGN